MHQLKININQFFLFKYNMLLYLLVIVEFPEAESVSSQTKQVCFDEVNL